MDKPTCSIEGCTKPAFCRQMCQACYARWRRRNPDVAQATRNIPRDVAFWARVDKGNGDDSCWTWLGALDRYGYGSFSHKGKVAKAHRMSYEMTVGPPPDTLDHLCRNRACVNPSHLEPVTRGENVLRGNGWSGRNARKTHCPEGHEYDAVRRGSRECTTCRRQKAAERRKA